MKVYRQPKLCVIQPIRGANKTVAKYCAELKIAEAVPRSGAGNQAATIRAFPGNEGDSARPIRNRREKSAITGMTAWKKPTKPCKPVKADHMSRLNAYTFFDPNRSRSHPPGI